MSTINVVTDFGADPTGTSESASSFNNALNAAGNHDVVFVPTGNYLTNQPIRILRGNVRLVGEGINKSVILPSLGDGEGGILITGRYARNAHFPPLPSDSVADQITNIVLDGITINGTREQQGNRPALEFGVLVDTQVNDCSIIHSYIHGCSHAGIRVADHRNPYPGRLYDLKIKNNIIEDMFGYVSPGESNPGQGLELFAVAHDIIVNGNTIRRCSGHGIRPIGSRSVQLENNTISECSNGISVQVDGSGGFPPTPIPSELWRIARDIEIANNRISSCDQCIEIREGTDAITLKNNVLIIDSYHTKAIVLLKAENEATSWPLGNVTIIGNTISVT